MLIKRLNYLLQFEWYSSAFTSLKYFYLIFISRAGLIPNMEHIYYLLKVSVNAQCLFSEN